VAPRGRRATLANVAASAGVSVATVSKVLNGRNDVAPATRALVQDLLHEHDYVARRVKPAPSQTIELFFRGQLNAYHTEVLQGVVEAAAEAGVAVVVSVRPRRQRGSGADRPTAWARAIDSVVRAVGRIVVWVEAAAEESTAMIRILSSGEPKTSVPRWLSTSSGSATKPLTPS
jgi:LacI family transcriptional regulator